MLSLILSLVSIASVEPMPIRSVIQPDFSTTICPNEASARRMLSDYIVAGPTNKDITLFFEGIAATNCVQSSGLVQIERVLARKSINTAPPESYVLYQGRRQSRVVYGIVNETWNNTHPRNAFERWMQRNTINGVLNAGSGERRTFVCTSVNAAKRFVAAIPQVRRSGFRDARQIEVKRRALQANGCRQIEGQFRITSIHASAFISLGDELGENWTAVTATNAQGRIVGLLHDDSEL